MRPIGLVGVGYIGKLFVDRLLAAGYPLTVYDVDDRQTAYATERGATAAESPAEVAREVETLVLALPGSAEVEATMAGGGDGDGAIAAFDGGELVVDASTTRPATSVACEERCDAAGVDFVEAPITGGAPREGYHLMVGGTADRYERASDLLDALGDDHVRVGPVPRGTVFKLGLQMRYAGHRAVDAEVVEFVRDNDVDPSLFSEFLGFDVWERYLTGDFTQDIEGLGGLAIWDKDVGYAREFARERGTALPLAAVVHEAYKAAVRRADDDEGHAAALVRYWLALNDAADRYD
ncbi:NAD(P)-dependent oxidoreductase [Candidatus Halobonum tyrrellensis]|uniref:2-hydroxy-3-oxopropionate reductase n=1 Tax=Candidatus Halobonum tyrrellensis G22 TaxID=1324957 RepID=V4HH46_9EURY|nr:NAD(P)-binding domain-containing protein [Candidatus Halobonum tyrrellensis]ESP90065.1 2-hydroxy-3-oxopropionate reductase [Candidatus Halobonum tyrrellensis G22]